jgi:hypothetical protein
MAMQYLRLGLAVTNNKGENMEPFHTEDPYLKGVYAAANAIVAQQKLMAEAFSKQEKEEDDE